MFSHVCVGVSDTTRAYDFYAPLFAELGLRLKFREPDGWSGWMPADAERPLFFFGKPLDGHPPEPGNGHTIAFDAPTRAHVDRCHALALRQAAPVKGRRACGRTITATTTALTSAIRTATSSAWSAIVQSDTRLSGLYRSLTG